jgi:hypothetical protein
MLLTPEHARPPAIADTEWDDTGQIGAVYTHSYYPAFIDIAPNSCFIAAVEGKPVYIHIVSHAKALEVTDFGNSLVEQTVGSLRIPAIGREIKTVDSASVSATAKDAWGSSGIVFAAEVALDGRIFRNTPFTEIIIAWEILRYQVGRCFTTPCSASS